MGRTPKPLSIAVDDVLAETPEIAALAAKGHNIYKFSQYNRGNDNPLNLPGVDLILGPNCWRMDATLLQYLDLAIKGARGVKYPKGKK
jgi:hypothetical protein